MARTEAAGTMRTHMKYGGKEMKTNNGLRREGDGNITLAKMSCGGVIIVWIRYDLVLLVALALRNGAKTTKSIQHNCIPFIIPIVFMESCNLMS